MVVHVLRGSCPLIRRRLRVLVLRPSSRRGRRRLRRPWVRILSCPLRFCEGLDFPGAGLQQPHGVGLRLRQRFGQQRVRSLGRSCLLCLCGLPARRRGVGIAVEVVRGSAVVAAALFLRARRLGRNSGRLTNAHRAVPGVVIGALVADRALTLAFGLVARRFTGGIRGLGPGVAGGVSRGRGALSGFVALWRRLGWAASCVSCFHGLCRLHCCAIDRVGLTCRGGFSRLFGGSLDLIGCCLGGNLLVWLIGGLGLPFLRGLAGARLGRPVSVWCCIGRGVGSRRSDVRGHVGVLGHRVRLRRRGSSVAARGCGLDGGL
mmetsp:Transcript_34111/g.105421  ORF Transcript_34111/g.105421 Transcript_34111/m.105421 type:complete len:318 (+) Transcript_34111:1141-2094(+)